MALTQVKKAVPDDIKRRVVPLLCREAVELTAKDVFSWRALAQGRSRIDVETAWEDSQGGRTSVTCVEPRPRRRPGRGQVEGGVDQPVRPR